MLARRLGAPDPLEKLRRQRAEIDMLLLAEIGERRAMGGGEDILSLLLDARFEDGAPMADQGGDLRPARDAARGRARDDRDGAGVDARAARAPPGGARAARRRLRRDVPEGGHQRVAAAATGRAAGGAAAVGAACVDVLRRCPRAPTSRRRSGSRTPVRTSTPSRSRSGRSAQLDGAPPPGYAWVPFGGGVRRCLGAAFAEMEMRVALATMLGAGPGREPRPPQPERVARRNVTFSPARGTRLVAWET